MINVTVMMTIMKTYLMKINMMMIIIKMPRTHREAKLELVACPTSLLQLKLSLSTKQKHHDHHVHHNKDKK